MVTPNVKEKIKLYHDAGLMVYPEAPFEAYFVRKQLDYLRFVDDLGLETVEVSDGSMVIEEDAVRDDSPFGKKYRVLSEVIRSRHPHQPQQVDVDDAAGTRSRKLESDC